MWLRRDGAEATFFRHKDFGMTSSCWGKQKKRPCLAPAEARPSFTSTKDSRDQYLGATRARATRQG